MNKKIKVCILMSTYNGQKYLVEQLESIFNQTEQSFKLVIRDDGSKDETIKILNEYKNKYPEKVTIILGENIGARDSFLFLLKNVELDSEFYALADQDDVWKPHKIERGILKIKKCKNTEKKEILYCSSYEFVDENLNYLIKGPSNTEKYNLDLRNSIYQAMIWGCTSVFNLEFLIKLREKQYSNENIIMHDVWLYLFASKFAYIIYDEDKTMLYRQHNSNLTLNLASFAESSSKIKIIRNKLEGIVLQKKKAQALKFFEIYKSELTEEEKKRILNFVISNNIISRIRNLQRKDIIINNVYNNAKFISGLIYVLFNA